VAVNFEQAPAAATADPLATTIALAFGSNVKVASVLWCNISFDISHDVISGVADSLNGAWTLAVGSTQTSDGQRNELWYRENSLAGACTVTVTWANTVGGATFRRLAVAEVSGCLTSGSLDQKVAAIGTSNSPDSTAKTTTADGEYIAGGIYTNTNAITVLNGFNSRMVTVKNVMVIDKTQTSQGSISVAVTIGGSENWNALMATFKASVSGRSWILGRH
jgi:hypothetical protein